MKVIEDERNNLNDGRTNLALHPNYQFREPARRINGVKNSPENLVDETAVRPFTRKKAKRHIKAIEVREKFWIWGRFQALFRENCQESLLLQTRESYQSNGQYVEQGKCKLE